MTFVHGNHSNMWHIFVNKEMRRWARFSISPSQILNGLVNYEGNEIGISLWNFNRLIPTVKYFLFYNISSMCCHNSGQAVPVQHKAVYWLRMKKPNYKMVLLFGIHCLPFREELIYFLYCLVCVTIKFALVNIWIKDIDRI